MSLSAGLQTIRDLMMLKQLYGEFYKGTTNAEEGLKRVYSEFFKDVPEEKKDELEEMMQEAAEARKITPVEFKGAEGLKFRYENSPVQFEAPDYLLKLDGSVYNQEALVQTAIRNYKRSQIKYR